MRSPAVEKREFLVDVPEIYHWKLMTDPVEGGT